MTDRASGRGRGPLSGRVRPRPNSGPSPPPPPSSSSSLNYSISFPLVPSLNSVADPACPNSGGGGGKSKGEISPGDCCACPPPRPRRRWRRTRTRTRTLEGRTPRWGWWHSSFPSGGGRGMKSNPLCPRGRSALPTGPADGYGYMARSLASRLPLLPPNFVQVYPVSATLKPHTWRELPSSPASLLSGYWGRGRDGGRSGEVVAPPCVCVRARGLDMPSRHNQNPPPSLPPSPPLFPLPQPFRLISRCPILS